MNFGRNTTAKLALRHLPCTSKELALKLRVSRVTTNVALARLIDMGLATITHEVKVKHGFAPVYGRLNDRQST